MSGAFHESKTCFLCTGPLVEMLRLVNTPIANALAILESEPTCSYPLYLSQCESCGHVQLPVVIDPKLLFPSDYPYVSGTSPVFVRHLAEQVSAVSDHCALKSNDAIVEVGSNDGTLLGMLRESGYRAVGIDPALELAKTATESGNITLGASFSEIIGKSLAEVCGRAKVVIANNVLAHAANVLDIVRGIHEALEPGGTLVLEVGYLPDVLTTNNFPVIYHEHLAYWCLDPMRRAFSENGLHIYHAHRIDSQGGSVRVYAQKIGQDALVPPWTASLIGLMNAECDIGESLRLWPQRIDDATGALYRMLRRIKASGKTIAGYGAAAKATTLLHQCGIGRDMIECVFDANPRKIGKFLPGNGIPIVSKSELEPRNYDYCIVLSGNFSSSIRSQHPEYKGRWIEPLPMPSILGGELAA